MALSAILNGQEFHVGDTVRVHQRIQEDNKTRIQVFEGTVLAIRGKESGKMYTVRRIGAGSVAIERIFPMDSPSVEKIEVKAQGHVRRSKLYYLRNKTQRELAEITRRKTTQKSISKPAKKATRPKKK
ncbi:MAG: 50S ribosomal protein L19 [Candidatus Blackburnbacteria bacterium RIFCSPHIGHO2_02_FULL_39_13]|uniref:50S ribosomal protein L19 n=1 Tax=Candidatus Blackburnbacteria bacterium RIFCSPLOWO2_01_FULL_40_20 TaxID=1797519 RepID=A0A1G1VDE7_9BACT|nr:MAG: 50S ribosomal protein L19 [Candidatus Blackburnbacteria bacterium RIFCSPHIGHO2_01_FULL_40_17]OGY09632.1 MAG: 50S ribosomal protein L19 [Candidatus Blackburnbacteria bacterium RIFCSPHIGHO2_02_FULL_39_13]OGY13222.1 MAG: 50S ribosomal protein L19 [Candidatus Blackburnbacteria bacterium RIFCSPLOWO2_01_FULL_40_20]HBL52376.1 50S ribosomal protein L19 [Candidatus Blackburnbacteria bacterium]